MYLHEDKELFSEVLEKSKSETGLPLKIVEKDYYVTMILYSLSQKSKNVVFKGGTSLSKCFHAINRFSEDIDITFTEYLGDKKRKHLKYDVMQKISEELKMPILNWNEIQSDRDLNNYIFSYESVLDIDDKDKIPSEVKVETALASYSFPVKELEIDSYVRQFLIKENQNIVDEYNLGLFKMKVQSLERTFIDKVYALCDYYLEKKSKRYSRHLYDLYKLRPLIKFDDDFKILIKEIYNHRSKMKICPSAKPGIDISCIIKEFCENDFFKSDYIEITSYFTKDPVDYDLTKQNILSLADTGLF